MQKMVHLNFVTKISRAWGGWDSKNRQLNSETRKQRNSLGWKCTFLNFEVYVSQWAPAKNNQIV